MGARVSNKRKHQEHPSEYSVARKIARKKYGFKCAMCGEYHEHVSLHHVFSKSKYPQYATTPENLIALCWEHHEKFHKIYEGTDNVTIYNLVEYMCDYANSHPEHKLSIHNIIEELFMALSQIIEELGDEQL